MSRIIASLIILFAISGAVQSYGVIQGLNRQLNERMMRLEICYDYSDKKGDYQWRHNVCKGIEKEILEDKDFLAK
jgi:hypothetical protein